MPAGTGESMEKGLLALFFDLGDTIMDEGTEVKDAELTTLRAELIPGLDDALRQCKRRVSRLALVADTRPGTASNVLAQHGLADLFDYLAISEIVGVEKPDPRLFQAALDALKIAPADYGRVAMVGNNLERDIAGARRLGLITIFLHWNERRRTIPLTPDETPDYTVHDAAELVALVDRLAAG
jgi:FMN phosphatase YigB (HAD superfamily)